MTPRKKGKRGMDARTLVHRLFWVALAAALAIAGAAFWTTRYTIVPAWRATYRLDRWTGQVAVCYGACTTLPEKPPPEANPFDQFDKPK